MKKIVTLFITICVLLTTVGCSKMKETVSNAGSYVKERGELLGEKISEIQVPDFKKGWETVVSYAGAAYATATSADYIQNVVNQINKLKVDVNQSLGSARSVAREAGFVAEKWVANTFNANAVVAGSSNSASVVGSNGLGSVDVSTSYGENASLKVYEDGAGSANAQATNYLKAYRESGTSDSLKDWTDKHGIDSDMKTMLSSIYEGQTRIIAKDQMDDAVKFLTGKIDRISKSTDPNAAIPVESLNETLSNLKTALESPDGVSSAEFTQADMQAITELAIDGKFDPAEFGISLSSLIQPKYIVKQAMNTGTKTAIFKAALTIGPELYSIICESIKTGQINKDDLLMLGKDSAVAGAEGYIEGAASAAITIACKAGKFGSELTNANPNVIAMITILAVDAIKYGYAFANGDITANDYGNLIAEEIVVLSGSFVVGTALATMLPSFGIAYLAGSMAGGIIATIGLDSTKSLILEIQDGGGFAAIMPEIVSSGIETFKDTLSNLNLKETISNFKDVAISTLSSGKIKVSVS